MKIVIAAGGTGGHVFPALAVARSLIERGHTCIWAGRPGSLESNTAKASGITFYPIRMSGLRGRRTDKQLLALWQSMVASFRLLIWMRQLARQDNILVATFGGYTSVAAGIAARLNHLPLVIHEQNSFPGSANRLLSRWADAICCGFDAVFADHPRRHYLGNPVRTQPPPRYSSDKRPLRILVLGGSLGAASLNRAITGLLARHPLGQRIHLVHQCGSVSYRQTQRAYAKCAAQQPLLRVRLQPFLRRIDWYYPWCDMIVCRAGAITLAEICHAGKTALLIPFPYATDDHQLHNAKALVASGGATLIKDDHALEEQLASLLLPWVQQPASAIRAELHQRGKLLAKLAKPNAKSDMADLIEKLGNRHKGATRT